MQCCGSELIFFEFGFGSTNFFRFQIRILTLIFWPEIVLNGASHCFYMCSGSCTTEKKVFQLKNLRFFSFKYLTCDFSHKIFLFYNSVWIRIQIRTFFSDPDSDPQHCLYVSTVTSNLVRPSLSMFCKDIVYSHYSELSLFSRTKQFICITAGYRTNWNHARSKVLPNEIRFYEAKLKLWKYIGIKGPLLPTFCETVPLKKLQSSFRPTPISKGLNRTGTFTISLLWCIG
jgi:hypothetical protein